MRFEVSEPFETSMYCHCTRCQRRTGTAASVNARATPEAFRIVQGEDRLRAWDPPDDGAEKFFCGDCGSALFSRSPSSLGVRLGAIDGDPGDPPGLPAVRRPTPPSWEPIPDDEAALAIPEARSAS